MKVCVDAGHGGRDPGAVAGGVAEKDVVLEYAKELAHALVELGYEVLLTRESDTFVGLSERAMLANRWGARVFLSVHMNAASIATRNGLWVIHDDDTKPEAGVALSHAIFRRMAAIPGIADEDPEPEVYADKTGWVNDRELTVVSETNMPAALIELGFISNMEDRVQLMDPLLMEEVCKAIAVGVTDWYHSVVIPVAPEAKLEQTEFVWPTPEFFYVEMLPTMLDVDLKEVPVLQADGIRGAVMTFLERNITEETTDWAIDQVRPVLPLPMASSWLLDRLLPDVVLDIFRRMLGRQANGG